MIFLEAGALDLDVAVLPLDAKDPPVKLDAFAVTSKYKPRAKPSV
jgi:hypothetical protein